MSEHAPRVWKIAAIGFDHRHMGDLLRMAHKHPGAILAGLCDPLRERMETAARSFDIPPDRLFTDSTTCLDASDPDLVILGHAAPEHRKWVEELAPHGVHILLEKPFASNLADADAMVSAMAETGKRLAINWPMAWYPSHATCKRVIAEGRIGDPLEVHFLGGNRGPLHKPDSQEPFGDQVPLAEKLASPWYREDRGGGSLQDYLGYGATLATWFLGGQVPIEVTAMTDSPAVLQVDGHSITLARYRGGLSRFETRWGTFTDPWTHQPQPKCGFVVVGTEGTVSSFDFEKTLRLQDRSHPEGYELPVDQLQPPYRNPVQYLIHCIESGRPLEGTTSPAVSRIGQRIVDAAALSARTGKSVSLKDAGAAS